MKLPTRLAQNGGTETQAPVPRASRNRLNGRTEHLSQNGYGHKRTSAYPPGCSPPTVAFTTTVVSKREGNEPPRWATRRTPPPHRCLPPEGSRVASSQWPPGPPRRNSITHMRLVCVPTTRGKGRATLRPESLSELCSVHVQGDQLWKAKASVLIPPSSSESLEDRYCVFSSRRVKVLLGCPRANSLGPATHAVKMMFSKMSSVRVPCHHWTWTI